MYTWIYFFTVFLKNGNISFKIKRSKITDYAALRQTHSSKITSKVMQPALSLLQWLFDTIFQEGNTFGINPIYHVVPWTQKTYKITYIYIKHLFLKTNSKGVVQSLDM